MGLFDRFTKKKTTDQLKQNAAPASAKSTKKADKEEVKKSVEKAEKKVEKNETKQAVPAQGKGHLAYRVLIRPLVTEKAAVMNSANKYAFVVAASATKEVVKQAVKEMYNVDVKHVNIINVQGRRVRFGRGMGKRSDFKKAIVTLPAGKSITIHEGV